MRSAYPFRPRPDAYDSSMLDKLNARRPIDSRSPTQWSPLSSSARDNCNRPPPMQLPKLLSLPERTRLHQPILDSPHRYSQTPLASAPSPRCHLFRHGSSQTGDYRSPLSAESGDFEQSGYARTRRNNSGSIGDDVSTQGSGEMRDDDADFPMEETSRLRMLNIDDPYRDRERDRGQKRRASSPAEPGVVPLASDMFRRRDANGMSRGSPTPRLTPIPQSSVSSVSSTGRSATSYAGVTTASSMTSMASSYDRRSPKGASPISPGSPYAASTSLGGLSRQSPNSRGVIMQQPHQRTVSELSAGAQGNRAFTSPRRPGEVPKPSGSLLAAKMQGFFMCECCPKKPKKFETQEELRYVQIPLYRPAGLGAIVWCKGPVVRCRRLTVA